MLYYASLVIGEYRPDIIDIHLLGTFTGSIKTEIHVGLSVPMSRCTIYVLIEELCECKGLGARLFISIIINIFNNNKCCPVPTGTILIYMANRNHVDLCL